MTIRFCGSSDNANPSRGLCDEYRIDAILDVAGLVSTARRLALDHPGHRPLLSLDDFRQAVYTSGHAIETWDLDDTRNADLSGLPPECFEDGAHRGYFAVKAEFPIRARNFARLADEVGFGDACAFGLSLDAEARDDWLAFQDAPLTLLDPPVSALMVPVVHGEEALAAFPNGYFTSDLGPGLNAAVARHFRQAHGYELVGIGASYLGLWRDEPPDGTAVAAIAADFRSLYNIAAEDWADFAPHVAASIAGCPHLWLRYVE